MPILETALKVLNETMRCYPNFRKEDFIWVTGLAVKQELVGTYGRFCGAFMYGIEIKDELVNNPNAICLIPRRTYEDGIY